MVLSDYGSFESEPLAYAAGLVILAGSGRVAGTRCRYCSTTTAMMTLAMRHRGSWRGIRAEPRRWCWASIYIFGAWQDGRLCCATIHPWWLVFGLVVSWIGDTGAYYVGRRWGRRKLAPRVSPG